MHNLQHSTDQSLDEYPRSLYCEHDASFSNRYLAEYLLTLVSEVSEDRRIRKWCVIFNSKVSTVREHSKHMVAKHLMIVNGRWYRYSAYSSRNK